MVTKKVYGYDTRIEAGSSKLEARVSNVHIRASIRASTTTNVHFYLMKKIGIKYCGGCNPSYERVEIVHRAHSHLNHPFHFVHHDQSDIDAMLLISGCQRACALQDLNRTVTHFSVTGKNDLEALMGWLKSLAPKGEG
jgi:hypothetical protein